MQPASLPSRLGMTDKIGRGGATEKIIHKNTSWKQKRKLCPGPAGGLAPHIAPSPTQPESPSGNHSPGLQGTVSNNHLRVTRESSICAALGRQHPGVGDPRSPLDALICPGAPPRHILSLRLSPQPLSAKEPRVQPAGPSHPGRDRHSGELSRRPPLIL